ncbi:MAG TPA: hypothetical protein VK308_14525 [Pyrinomonadaceae bacterium]|nr:hypothetical protein [Pyrinomonadaceae bacterium]
MQFDLFATLVAPATQPQESFSKKVKKAFVQERKYQAMKNESERLQKSWKKLQPLIETERVADRKRYDEIESAEPITVVLVSCVSTKAGESCPAKELYQSNWFKKARKYAEEKGDTWYILSALYGLIEPEQRIEPYNYTLNGKRKADRESWAQRTASELRQRVPPKSTIIILAGLKYRENLIPLLADKYTLIVPLKNLGIGKQLAYLKEANQ